MDISDMITQVGMSYGHFWHDNTDSSAYMPAI